MTHSPAPWHFDNHHIIVESENLIVDKEGRFIAIVQGQSNARLIKVAPLMLEALKKIVSVEFCAANHYAGLNESGFAYVINIAQAAIDAVKGKDIPR